MSRRKGKRMFKHHSKLNLRVLSGLLLLFVAIPLRARAQFGGGTVTVFDPSMFARQLSQLQQETAAVTDLAQQLQYMIKNTTGGGAGVWQSNQNLLANLGGLISEQQGLSYTFQGLAQQFQQLYPGYNVTSTPGVQSPQASVDTTLNTLNGALQSAQAQAQDFQAEQTSLQTLELKNQTAIGNLQAVQTGNEIALAEVQQIQMLRQLVVALMNSQNTATANQINSQTQSQLAAQALLSAPASPGTPDFLDASPQTPPQP
jgi:P-type conjugative transfer protein TrbJ